MKVLTVLLSLSAVALASLEPASYRPPGSSSSQYLLPHQQHDHDHYQHQQHQQHQQQDFQQQQQQQHYHDQQAQDHQHQHHLDEAQPSGFSALSSPTLGPSSQYGPPSQNRPAITTGFSSQQQPQQQYLPPQTHQQAPSILAPTNFLDKPHGGVSNDYLPPVASTPPPNEYLPPTQKHRPTSLPASTPPPKAYLPPSRPSPPSNEYLPPHPGSRQPSPPKNDYLPPPQVPTTRQPPKKEYLPPQTTTSRKPPKNDYLPPQVPPTSRQPPKNDYLPPSRGSQQHHHHQQQQQQQRVVASQTTSLPRTSLAPTISSYHADSQSYQKQQPSFGSGVNSLANPSPFAPGIKNYEQPSDNYLPPSAGHYDAAAQSGYQYDTFAGSGRLEESTEPAKYGFEYRVSDEFGNDFGHKETREGAQTLGSYSVLLPDGRKQIVSYEADEEGFRPRISYEEAATVLGSRTPALRGDGYPGYDINSLDSHQGPY